MCKCNQEYCDCCKKPKVTLGQKHTCIDISISIDSPRHCIEFRNVGSGSYFFHDNELQRRLPDCQVICVHSGRTMETPSDCCHVELMESIVIQG